MMPERPPLYSYRNERGEWAPAPFEKGAQRDDTFLQGRKFELHPAADPFCSELISDQRRISSTLIVIISSVCIRFGSAPRS